MANYRNQIFQRNGKDILYDEYVLVRDVQPSTDYKNNTIVTYNGNIYRFTQDITTSSNIDNDISNGYLEVISTGITDILKLPGMDTYPSNPSAGWIIHLQGHSTDSDGIYVYNGSTWSSIITW